MSWTYQITMRLPGRCISRQPILDAVNTYEILASYPEATYLPSSLVFAASGGEGFQILFAVDVPAEHGRVVTA
jgi:hypothetical protein